MVYFNFQICLKGPKLNCLSKKSRPNLYSNLLYKMGQVFLNIQYLLFTGFISRAAEAAVRYMEPASAATFIGKILKVDYYTSDWGRDIYILQDTMQVLRGGGK